LASITISRGNLLNGYGINHRFFIEAVYPPPSFFSYVGAIMELEQLSKVSRAIKRNGNWNYAVFIPSKDGFDFELERAKRNKRYINAYELENGALVLIKAESKEEALKKLSAYLTISDREKALEWLESNPVKELGKETLKLRKFQVFRELSDGRLKLSYNRRYLKELEKQIHKVCHTRHYKGARKRDLRELTKYVNQIVRALRKESRYLWVPPEQKRGFNREVRKAVREALTSMYGFKKEKALAYIEKFILLWK
jgi:16S rRNA C967 or C1407 C5-methylase (RsmB/RsmF family)